MIIIDFSHLSMRNLFTSIPKKNKFTTDEYISVYFHQMFKSIQSIQAYQNQGYGEIVLALDSRNNWRKDAVKNYKGNRKVARKESPVNFEEFFVEVDKLIDVFKNGLGLKTILVDKVEADDIGYVLSHLTEEKTLLITEDKDWVQNLIGNLSVDIYKPIKKELIKNSPKIQEELIAKRFVHCMIGDKVDDIPSILDNLNYSDEFNKFLISKGIDLLPPRDLEKLDFFDEVLDEFKKVYEDDPKVKVYKVGRFGEKTAEKVVKNKTPFLEKHKENHKRILDNFKQNRKLIDMSKIPKQYKDKILEEFVNCKPTKNIKLVQDFLNENSLHQIANSLNINGITSNDLTQSSMGFTSFDDMTFDFSKPLSNVEPEPQKDDFSEWGF